MRDFVLALLTLAAIALGVTVYSQHEAITALNANIAAMPQATSLDLQAKCARQAEEDYKDGGWQSNELASYSDHYNGALNKCFIFIQSTDDNKNIQALVTSESLYDAFEMKDYGEYMDFNYYDQSKAPIITCTVSHADGTQTSCSSEDEFKRAVEYFMGPGV